MNSQKQRICFVVSAPETASSFLNPHIDRLAQVFEVHVIAHVKGPHSISGNARVISIPIERSVLPLKDARALRLLRQALKQGRYSATHSVTPKAGLLTALATIGLGIDLRIHWFTGQVWVTKRGLKRFALKSMDRFVAQRCTETLVDSASQCEFLVSEGVVRVRNATVLGHGSICGVDTERFRPDQTARAEIRSHLGIGPQSPVALFVGRLNRDKGVLELARAFRQLPNELDASLIYVGHDEENLAGQIKSSAGTAAHGVHIVGPSSKPEAFMAASDVFCMPSYREGFGLSVIEAAAVELPSVASNIYGLSDAVVDGVTGTLVSVKDENDLVRALTQMLTDSVARKSMGALARKRVHAEFRSVNLTKNLLDLYEDRLNSKGCAFHGSDDGSSVHQDG